MTQTNLSVPDQYGENVFLIIGSVTKTLKQNGYRELAKEVQSRATNECKSYDEVCSMLEKYVIFV